MAGAIGAVLVAVGCNALSINLTDDCEYMLTCEHHDWLESGGDGGSAPNPGCEADPTEDASTVTNECAVFASATAEAGGDGTKEKPYASLAEAIAKAKGKRVLACTSGAFAESVRIEAGVEVIGGFDCDAEWTWSEGARSTIEGPADRVALTLSEGASGVKVRSFAIRAANATVAGGSSIGVAVADIEAELAQVDVTAGDGMDGANGETPTGEPRRGASAAEMSASNACEVVEAVRGGEPGVTTCDDGETRGGVGGLGGKPDVDDGDAYSGGNGVPLPENNSEGNGLGGVGQTAAAANCRAGQPGAPGTDGNAGAGGDRTTLTLTGVVGGDGGNGGPGMRGQGGGGGGGAKAGLFCGAAANPVKGPGASGGGGGAGGCGGKGGGGGKAGGSSIGIVSLGTKLVLREVTVAVDKAGNGGAGVLGQSGADGGEGAMGGTRSAVAGSIAGCKGGDGGPGGAGGPGGGGRGGHAVGIAYAAAPSTAVALDFVEGTAGDGGGTPPGGNTGAPGVSGACWNFEANESCGQ